MILFAMVKGVLEVHHVHKNSKSYLKDHLIDTCNHVPIEGKAWEEQVLAA